MKFKKTVSIVVLFVLLAFNVNAQTPYYSYSQDGKAAPDGAIVETIFNGNTIGVGEFKSPSDIFAAQNGNLYILDKGNNRIIIINHKYELVQQINGFTNGDKNELFNAPEGLYVDNNSNVYIADTGNGRVVVLSADGKLLKLLLAPQSEALPKEFLFKPSKIMLDSAKNIYVISKDFNMGLLLFDKNFEFVQMLGAPRVMFNATDYLWRLFSTKQQNQLSVGFVPIEYNNLCIDSEDFVFVTSNSFSIYDYQANKATPLRRLNALGNDILRISDRTQPPYGDSEFNNAGDFKGPSKLIDICTFENGMYATLDSNRCRVFVYGEDGIMLFGFGAPGNLNGTFRQPASIEYYNSRFLVLDSYKNSVTVFSKTNYSEAIFSAITSRYANDYSGETQNWNKVLESNSNDKNALIGLGKSYFSLKLYEEAMNYFKLANDKENYSKALRNFRKTVASKYFTITFIAFILAILAIVIFFKFRKKIFKKKVELHSYLGTLLYARIPIFRPFRGFYELKYEKMGSLKAALTILGVLTVIFALQNSLLGFIFAPDSNRNNIFFGALSLLIPFILFAVCNWCVTSLMEGEGSFKDIVTATAYALTPLIFMLPLTIIISNLVTLQEKELYAVLVALTYVWTAFLIVSSNKQIHDYSMGKAIAILIITLLVMVIVIFLAVLFFALIQQMYGFVVDYINELSLRT